MKRRRMIRIRIKHLSELVVPFDVELMSLHEPPLLGHEATVEESFEGGLGRCPEEKGVAQGEVDGGHEEANGLHHIPAQFPESEPHGPDRLE